jgi:hypothetical protein
VSGIVAPLVLDGPMTGAAFCAYYYLRHCGYGSI